jgi:hypothetical protein
MDGLILRCEDRKVQASKEVPQTPALTTDPSRLGAQPLAPQDEALRFAVALRIHAITPGDTRAGLVGGGAKPKCVRPGVQSH